MEFEQWWSEMVGSGQKEFSYQYTKKIAREAFSKGYLTGIEDLKNKVIETFSVGLV